MGFLRVPARNTGLVPLYARQLVSGRGPSYNIQFSLYKQGRVDPQALTGDTCRAGHNVIRGEDMQLALGCGDWGAHARDRELRTGSALILW